MSYVYYTCTQQLTDIPLRYYFKSVNLYLGLIKSLDVVNRGAFKLLRDKYKTTAIYVGYEFELECGDACLSCTVHRVGTRCAVAAGFEVAFHSSA